MKGAPRISPGFFDDALREANLRIRLSQSHGLHNHPTPAPRQRTLGRFSFFWRRSKPHRTTERDTQFRPFRWTGNLSSLLRRGDGSDMQLRELEVPYTAGKPRNYHARKKRAASLSRPPNTHTTQQPNGAAQGTPSSSQQSSTSSTTTASISSAVTGAAGTTGTLSHPYINVTGWRVHFVGWLCCMTIQDTNGQH
ncbi:hypothetical protein BD769DRAFT_1111018 [Suillus cothurnatus]|nr:hypothetical protein BD769DRAFT_1111018 [Suillus cothurnatus]